MLSALQLPQQSSELSPKARRDVLIPEVLIGMVLVPVVLVPVVLVPIVLVPIVHVAEVHVGEELLRIATVATRAMFRRCSSGKRVELERGDHGDRERDGRHSLDEGSAVELCSCEIRFWSFVHHGPLPGTLTV